jgi:hypothetical protein
MACRQEAEVVLVARLHGESVVEEHSTARTASKLDVPRFDALMQPILTALKELGGSASNQELQGEGTRYR